MRFRSESHAWSYFLIGQCKNKMVTEGNDGVLTLEEHGSSTGRALECELVERDDCTTGLDDTCSGTSCDVCGANRELWGFEHTDVIGNGTDADSDGLWGASHLSCNLGDGQRLLLGSGHHKTLEDNLCERQKRGGVRV